MARLSQTKSLSALDNHHGSSTYKFRAVLRHLDMILAQSGYAGSPQHETSMVEASYGGHIKGSSHH